MADGMEAVAWAIAKQIDENERQAGGKIKTREDWLALVKECAKALR